MSTSAPFGIDLEFRPLIDIDPHRLFTDPSGVFSDLDKRIQELKAQGIENFEAFKASPAEGVKRIWTQATGYPATFATKVGLISNLLVAAGLFVGSPVLITVSLIASSIAHMTGAEEAKQKELVERTMVHLKAVNDTLIKTNESLRKEVHDLRGIVKSLKEENEKLHTSNQELKRSIGDLQKSINMLQEHISSLQTFNSVFKESLKSLALSIEHFKQENGRVGARVESIQGLERSFESIRREFMVFSEQFHSTKEILSTQQQDIKQQLTQLTSLVQIIHDRVPELARIRELSLVQAQFLLAIEGVKQYQELLVQTQASLESAQNRCAQEHNRMRESRKACEVMLKKFEFMFVDRSEYYKKMLQKRFDIHNRGGDIPHIP